MYFIVYVMRKHTNAFRNCCAFLNKYRANLQLEPDRLLSPEEYGQPLLNGDWPENEHSTSATPAAAGPS